MKKVRYIVRGTDGGSTGCRNIAGAIKYAAWMLLRAAEPHRVVTVEVAVYCASCGGAGELPRPRGAPKRCPYCKGQDSYQVVSTEELRAEDLKEAIK